MAEPVSAPIIRPRKSDLALNAKFSGHLWAVFHDIPKLYGALLTELKDFGVAPAGIRSEAGDGSLAGYSLSFWMLELKALVRLRLDGADVQYNGISAGEIPRLGSALVALERALHAAAPELTVASYTLDLGVHAELNGVELKDFLQHYVSARPEGLGPSAGNGAVFYYGPVAPFAMRALTIDLSAALASGLFMRLYCVLDGSVGANELAVVMAEQMPLVYRALGLRVESNG